MNVHGHACTCLVSIWEMGLDRQEQTHRLHHSLEIKPRPLELDMGTNVDLIKGLKWFNPV